MTPSSPLSDPGQSDPHPRPKSPTQPNPSGQRSQGGWKAYQEYRDARIKQEREEKDIQRRAAALYHDNGDGDGGDGVGNNDRDHDNGKEDDGDAGEEGEEDRTIIGLTSAMTSTSGPETTTTNATPSKIKISLRVGGKDDRAAEDRNRAPTRPEDEEDKGEEEEGEEDDESVSSITSSTIPYHDSPSPQPSSSPPPIYDGRPPNRLLELDEEAEKLCGDEMDEEDEEDDDDDDDEEEDMEVDPVEPDEVGDVSRMEVEEEGKADADERDEDEPSSRISVKGIGTEAVGGASGPGAAAVAGPGFKTDTRGDDTASELTQISDDSDREDAMSEDDEDVDEDVDVDVDEDGALLDVDEWDAQEQDVASVPPPNTKSTSRPPTSSSNNQPSTTSTSSTAKPLSSGPATGNRKPSIFGSRSDEPEIPDDDNESELTDSEAESTTATPEYSRVVPVISSSRDGFSGASDAVVLAEDPALDPAVQAEGTARRLSIATNKKTDDEEKPYSPPKTAKKGILGRTTEGETESVMSEDEEEDDDEGGQGMLVKDAVRRESEGKTKLTQDDEEEDEEDKGVAGESASLEERGELGQVN